jgi:hypothetical protein
VPALLVLKPVDLELAEGLEMPEDLDLVEGLEMPEDLELSEGLELAECLELAESLEASEGPEQPVDPETPEGHGDFDEHGETGEAAGHGETGEAAGPAEIDGRLERHEHRPAGPASSVVATPSADWAEVPWKEDHSIPASAVADAAGLDLLVPGTTPAAAAAAAAAVARGPEQNTVESAFPERHLAPDSAAGLAKKEAAAAILVEVQQETHLGP